MREFRIFTDQALEPNQEILLSDERYHYLIRVLRCPRGTRLCLFNGNGQDIEGELLDANHKQARIQLLQIRPTETESPLELHLYQALSKGEKLDWIVQKAVELGVSAFHPMLTERSQPGLKAQKFEAKLRHWRRIVISASEQCGRSHLMAIHSIQPVTKTLTDRLGNIWFFTPKGGAQAQQMQAAASPMHLFIGPEGGFSDVEIALAQASGAHLLSLGHRILRTETAALAAVSIAQNLAGDLRWSKGPV